MTGFMKLMIKIGLLLRVMKRNTKEKMKEVEKAAQIIENEEKETKSLINKIHMPMFLKRPIQILTVNMCQSKKNQKKVAMWR